MNGEETQALRSILRAELEAAIAQLELRLVNRFAPAEVEGQVEELRRWRSFTKGAFAVLSILGVVALALAGYAVNSVLGSFLS